MTEEFGTEVNGEYCSGLVIDADTLATALTGDITEMDPFRVTWNRQKGDDFVAATETDADATDIDNAVAICREEYDSNDISATQAYFCCQMVVSSETGLVLATSTLGKMTSNDQPAFDEYTMGALVFQGAKAVAVSASAILAAAALFQ